MFDVERLTIPDVLYLKSRKFEDARGFLSETYNSEYLRRFGILVDFVQDNHSFSISTGTVRGLHFQGPPFTQHKLIRVAAGRILDVCVDLRRSSPTFKQHVSVELSSRQWDQIFVPAGFAHGFCTLEPNTEVLYKVSSYYAPQHDYGVRWNDPALKIKWPVLADTAVLSDKDRQLPLLQDIAIRF